MTSERWNYLAGARDARQPCAGELLVASPGMDDGEFGRTVVYLIEHGTEGTLGVVLNKPMRASVRELLGAWASFVAPPDALFHGGPLQRDSGLALAVAAPGEHLDDDEHIHNVESRVYMVDLDTDPAVLSPAVEGVRIFAGYSSWVPGQLSAELARGDWIVALGLPSDVIGGTGTDLWADVIRRQGPPLSLYATFPADPNLN
ncbi:YqgE/AlgH family protein [Dietzia sp.]|uniref:YqgE/AlgH family protein n=1 Tax=Dietzia sp. TaxID=1871616 RepID=UPI002FDAC629